MLWDSGEVPWLSPRKDRCGGGGDAPSSLGSRQVPGPQAFPGTQSKRSIRHRGRRAHPHSARLAPHATQAWPAGETRPGHPAGWHSREKSCSKDPTPTPGAKGPQGKLGMGCGETGHGRGRGPGTCWSIHHLPAESSWACVEAGGEGVGGSAWCGELAGAAGQCTLWPLLPTGPCPLRTVTMMLRNEPSFWEAPQPGPHPRARRPALTGSPASPFSPGRPGFPRSPWNTKQVTVRGQCLVYF